MSALNASNDKFRGLISKSSNVPLPALICSKVLFCAMPIAQIALGAVNLNDCPLQPYIPIYLIVSGVFSLLLVILAALPCTQGSNQLSCLCTAWNSLTTFFLFCWFIAGNVWIYSIYEPNYNKNSNSTELYCDKTVYLFAFWTSTLVYILAGLLMFGGVCCLLCTCLCKADPDDH
ncbi:uncharacterized protein LOC101165594 [Oryzias latipes]|uniref:Si:dkey-19b23.12 n=1 Tax=Oryzias latipes TaxID=8090 RepID=H2LRH9_ORYLA|nr:uncharacterized protein LOC101165594 [Oryzias latipes]